MVGTGTGTAGLGRAKAESVAEAVQIATNLAKKNLISIARHRGCTVSRTNLYKYKRTKVLVKACRTGYGIRSSPEMRVVLRAFGLTDMCVVTIGRKTNRQAMYRALFKGFQEDIRTPEEITKALGKKRFDIAAFYYSPKK